MRDRPIERLAELLTYAAWKESLQEPDSLGFWNLLFLGCLAAESYILGDYTEDFYQQRKDWLKRRWAARSRRAERSKENATI